MAGGSLLERQRRIGTNHVQGGFDLRVLRAPPLSIEQEQTAHRNVGHPAVGDKVPQVGPAGSLRVVNLSHELRPMPAPSIAQLRYFHGHQDLIHRARIRNQRNLAQGVVSVARGASKE